MILQSILEYVSQQGRIEESALLTHFHLRQEGLAPMIGVLVNLGKIQKTVHQRGGQLAPLVYYSCPLSKQIPAITIV